MITSRWDRPGKENFARFGLLDDQVHFLKGWFRQLPSAEISQLAIIRLDGDYYESTDDGFVDLYPKKALARGLCNRDHYGEETWTYCRRVVDDYRAMEVCTNL